MIKKEKLRAAWERFRGGKLTPRRAGLSIGIGITIGCLPLYGVHWLLVVGICLPLRLDAAVSYLAANISNPFIAPFLLLAEAQIGSLLMTGHWLPLTAKDLSERGFSGVLSQTVIGTIVFAPALGLLLGAIAYGLTALWRRNRGA